MFFTGPLGLIAVTLKRENKTKTKANSTTRGSLPHIIYFDSFVVVHKSQKAKFTNLDRAVSCLVFKVHVSTFQS